MSANVGNPPDIVLWNARSGEGLGDCGLAAISLATGHAYEQVLGVAMLVQPNVLAEGLTIRQIRKILKVLGFDSAHTKVPRGKKSRAEFIEKLEEDEASGLLDIYNAKDEGHIVYVWAGRPLEPAAGVRKMFIDIDAYLAIEPWTPAGFMTIKKEERTA